MKKAGFTLIELLISISVLAIISTATVAVYKVWQNKNVLSSTRQIVVQSMREAQRHAVSGANDSAWGVKLNTSTLVVFSGNTYAGRDVSKDRNFDFSSNVQINGLSEIIFFKSTGVPNNSITTTIIYGGSSIQVGVSQQGVFSY